MWHVSMALGVLCAALAACAGAANGTAGDAGAAGDPEWHVAGVVVSADPAPASVRVTVQRDAGSPGPERAVLHVPPQAQVEVQRADGTVHAGTAADIVPGARILARHTGAEMRSLPPQYHAVRVRIIPRS